MSSNLSAGKKLKRRFEKENPTILTSTTHEEDVESDENYENEECSDSEDDDDVTEEDNDGDVVYIDDDEINVPAFPGEISFVMLFVGLIKEEHGPMIPPRLFGLWIRILPLPAVFFRTCDDRLLEEQTSHATCSANQSTSITVLPK